MLLIVDGAGEVTETFQQVDTERTISNPTDDPLVANKSKLSTASISDELRTDDEFFQLRQEYSSSTNSFIPLL
jgi:hypothetical protein